LFKSLQVKRFLVFCLICSRFNCNNMIKKRWLVLAFLLCRGHVVRPASGHVCHLLDADLKTSFFFVPEENKRSCCPADLRQFESDIRLFPRSSGYLLPGDAGGIEIQPAKFELDGVAESLFVAETATPDFGGFCSAVDTPSRVIGCFQGDGIENAPQVLPDRLGNFLYQCMTAASGTSQPFLPGF